MKVVRHKVTTLESVKAFDGIVPLDRDFQVKMREVKSEDSSMIDDYRDVIFDGYASTWNNTDRDGEVMVAGAFKETIKSFMRNPVALKDHTNKVDNIVGHYEELREDAKGLYIRCRISNAPDCKSVRFKVVEGSLRAMSVAGLMYLDESGRNIKQVILWEISLVAIPANPEALVETVFKMRDLNDSDRERFFLETGNPAQSGGSESVVKNAKRGLLIPQLNLRIKR